MKPKFKIIIMVAILIMFILPTNVLARNLNVTLPTFDVRIDNVKIDNENREYPLILFRNVTYLPLTWQFVVDEFGWDYKFTQENGLEINTFQNTGLKVTEVKLPLADQRDFHQGAFTVAGDYFYFEGEKGIIYQAPITEPSRLKAVYELPMWTYGDDYVYPHLQTDGGIAMLTYHQGGATMGTDHRIILNDDGTNEVFAIGYLNRKVFDEITVNVSHFPPPLPHNLSMKREGEAEFKAIGSDDYVYGWVKNIGQSRSNDLYRIGDEIYILAYKFNDVEATTGIHRVNTMTGETIRICDEPVQKFVVEGKMIYFMDLCGYLYKISLVDGGRAEKITDFTVSDFTVLHNTVYYVTEEDEGLELFKLDECISINLGGRVRELVKTEDYVYCIFEDNASYKLIVFDQTGQQIFKTKAKIRLASIAQNRLFYHKG